MLIEEDLGFNMAFNIGAAHEPGHVIGTTGIIHDNLELYIDPSDFDSYPGSGTTMTDLSGNGANGTMSAAAIGTTNEESNFLTFDGTDDYISFSAITTLDAWSLCFWLWHSVAQNANYERIFGAASFQFDIAEDTSDQITFYDGAWETAMSDVTVTATDGWVNLVFVFTAGPRMHIYRNGLQVKNSLVDGRALGGKAFKLGSRQASPGEYWAGYMGPFMVYSAMLTQSQVTCNFNADRGRFGV